MTDIPPALLTYIDGLKTHDIGKIGSSFAADIEFVTPVRTMHAREILEFLTALYTGFPDWHYDHDPPEPMLDGTIGIWWRQGGTHTQTLALPGYVVVPPTSRAVKIPEHYFFYRVTGGKLCMIRPDPVPGGAPRGIFEQIGVALPPL